MKKLSTSLLLSLMLYFVNAQQTITEWTFAGTNNTTIDGGIASPEPAVGTGTATLLGGTTATLAGGTSGTCNTSDGSGCGWNTATYAAQSAENGIRGVQFAASTSGYENIVLTFAHRASGTASRYARLDYSLDGGTNWITNFWTNTGGLSPSDNFYSFTVDFTSISGANDNPNFVVRIVSIFAPCDFVQNTTLSYSANQAYMRANVEAQCQPHTTTNTGNYATSGTWRFDDVKFVGTQIGLVIESVQLTSSAVVASEQDQTAITITATAANAVSTPQTVTLNVGGTNITTGDYVLSNPVITIPAGATQGSITFTVVDDNLNEGIETAVISIGSTSPGLSLGAQTSVSVEIEDNDAAVSLVTLDVPTSTITFDELQLTGINLFDVTRGFYIFEQGSNANATYRASDGTATTGDTYSFGAVSSSERALGSITTGSLTPNTFGALISNNTGTAVNTLTVQYTGEQWRSGSATGDTLYFAYSLDATGLDNGTWVAVNALNFIAPINGAGAALNGNLSENQVNFNVDISGFMMPNNGSMWIRWVDLDVLGTDHGMAIDNLILTPKYIPNPTIAANPTTLSGFNQILGAPSAEQSFVVSGFDLSDDVEITAPLGYEISFTSGDDFVTSLTITPVVGEVEATTVYVRLNATQANTYEGDVVLTSAPASDAFVELTGVAVVPSPELTVNPLVLTAFEQQLGTPSPQQSITVSGIHLVDDISIVSTGSFFIATSAAGPFSQSLTFEPIDGIVEPTQVFVQLNATTAGLHSGQITVSTENTSDVVIVLTGETIQPASIGVQGASELVIYPNPATDVIQVITSDEIRQISLLDLNGRVLVVSESTAIDIRGLQAGMYIMLIETLNGTVQRPFVKK
jgi:hypothetical protein